MSRFRFRSYSQTISIDVPIDDIIASIDDSQILKEAEERNLGYLISKDDLEEIYSLLNRGNGVDAMIAIERALPRRFAGMLTTFRSKVSA